jgi:hypothetical protein
VDRRSTVIALLCVGVLVVRPAAADAQEPVRVSGVVQWVSGMAIQVMTGAGTVAVDIREADQSAYRGLRTGERIVVDGAVSSDGRRVIAYSIRRSGESVESP